MRKKYKYVSFFLFILVLLIPSANGSNKQLLKNKTIIIDPGHGYLDPGTVYGNIYEKDINLKISLFLKDELIKKGANVLMTRNDDYDLSSPNALYRKKSDFDNRIKIINNSNANLYLSIHLNYLNNTRYSGPQVFYIDNNVYLAKIIQDSFNNSLKSKREIKTIPNNTYMYRKLIIPGVLIECGFLSNTNERNKLITEEYQKQIASIITDSIIKYYK